MGTGMHMVAHCSPRRARQVVSERIPAFLRELGVAELRDDVVGGREEGLWDGDMAEGGRRVAARRLLMACWKTISRRLGRGEEVGRRRRARDAAG